MNDLNVAGILKKASEKCGFNRVRWIEKDIPTSIDNVVILPFFGDIRSMFILSSLLLKRYREEVKGSKYFVMCSWPGYESLFPFVNEYWSIRENDSLNDCYTGTCGFENESKIALQYFKNLNQWFNACDIVTAEDLQVYYKNGITQQFWDRFKHIKRYLPSVPSSALLGQAFNLEMIKKPGTKVFIYPTELIQRWQCDKITNIKASKNFWTGLVRQLLDNKITPVIFKGANSQDIAHDLIDRCIYVRENDIAKVMAAMRVTGCVIDIFSGISRLAIAARTPYIYMDERIRNLGQKESEIEGLCCEKGLPREYVYSFPNVVTEGDEDVWRTNIYDIVLGKLFKFLPELDRENWPSPVENIETVLYENVKKDKMKKIGIQFIKVNRDMREKK